MDDFLQGKTSANSAVLNFDTKLCKENANFCQFLKQKLNWFGLGCLMV
jgi:hypothetical protein